MASINYKKIIQIILGSFAIGLAYNFISSKGISLIRTETEIVWTEESSVINESTEAGENLVLRALTTEQTYQIFLEKTAKFIDARDQWEFGDGHIPGAINIPEYKFTPEEPNLDQLKKNEKIIIYCEGDDCDVSKRLAEEMQKLGFSNIFVYVGGWREWSSNNYPIGKEE